MDAHVIGVLIACGLILLALVITGWTDASNAIVTVVSTGVLSVPVAIILAVLCNIIGGFWNNAVAMTISQNIVDPRVLTLPAVCAAMFSIIVWGGLAGKFGMPVSKSHSLVAGLAGAGVACGGWGALIALGWKAVAIGLLYSSFAGGIFGWIVAAFITTIMRLMVQYGLISSSRAEQICDQLQICTAAGMGIMHGSQDTQKYRGAFILILVLGGYVTTQNDVPWWISPLCAITMGIGTALGGRKIMRTVGQRMTQLNSRQGFCAELTAIGILFGLALNGVPASTTHTINTSVVGVVAYKGLKHVRWDVFGRIVLSWICTIPGGFTISYLTTEFLNLLF